jgi:hypothetical protein
VPKKKKKSKNEIEPPVCVDLFNVYDISNGTDERNKYFLFSIPLPASPVGLVPGITGTTPLPNFQPGRHKIAVGAHSPVTGDSDLTACWVIVKITPEELAPALSPGSPSGATSPSDAPRQTSESSSRQESTSTAQEATSQTTGRPRAPHC